MCEKQQLQQQYRKSANSEKNRQKISALQLFYFFHVKISFSICYPGRVKYTNHDEVIKKISGHFPSNENYIPRQFSKLIL